MGKPDGWSPYDTKFSWLLDQCSSSRQHLLKTDFYRRDGVGNWLRRKERQRVTLGRVSLGPQKAASAGDKWRKRGQCRTEWEEGEHCWRVREFTGLHGDQVTRGKLYIQVGLDEQ